MEHSTLERHINAGLTEREIAEAEGFSQSTVTYWLRKLGLKTKWKRGGWSRAGTTRKSGGHRGRSLDQWDWVAIQAKHDAGDTWNDLCKGFGLNIAAIAKAQKHGLFKSRNISEAQKLCHASGYDYSVYRTPEHRAKCRPQGGYKPRAGCGKGAWATNLAGQQFYLQSSYEIRMAELLNSMAILWIRPAGVGYVLDGRQREYFADFYLPAYNLYLDTKNDYLIKLDAAKIAAVKEQNKLALYVVSKLQITEAFVRSLFVS